MKVVGEWRHAKGDTANAEALKAASTGVGEGDVRCRVDERKPLK